jgi:hypothetical protein
MAKNSVFSKIFEERFFREMSLRHSWTDKFTGTGSPARQF